MLINWTNFQEFGSRKVGDPMKKKMMWGEYRLITLYHLRYVLEGQMKPFEGDYQLWIEWTWDLMGSFQQYRQMYASKMAGYLYLVLNPHR